MLQSYKDLMHSDERVIAFGLGINDPKGIFGTTLGLAEQFGQKGFSDIPTSENALTGVGVGLAIGGYKPILCHQRFDFALAIDRPTGKFGSEMALYVWPSIHSSHHRKNDNWAAGDRGRRTPSAITAGLSRFRD